MAKRKLQMLNNHVFEELAMDVYDEIDRRETDAIWNGLLSKVSKANNPIRVVEFITSWISTSFDIIKTSSSSSTDLRFDV